MRYLQKVVNALTSSLKKAPKEKQSLHVIFDATVFLMFIAALIFFPYFSAHADTNLTVDGSQQFQKIDGFGVNANSLSWNNGELKAAIDMLADEMGSTQWRVVIDQEDWEAVNDNSDPNVFNWDYYNSVYSSPKFQNLWATIGYLNQKGISSGIILSFMGNVSNWMGGTTINPADEDEWVEMIASLVYYARNTMHLSFFMLDPLNETDWGHNEGPLVDQTQYTRLLHKLSDKFDSIGLSDMKFVGPATAGISNGINVYMPVMLADSVVMAKTDHFGLHNYASEGDTAYQYIKNSAYPNRNYYITETTLPVDIFYELSQGTSAVIIWDGYDSVYNHAILNGGGTTPPNDAGPGPAPLAYDMTTGIYSPRKCFYEYEQVFKFVPSGSVRISASQSNGNVVITAYYHQTSGRVSIVGRNSGTSSVSYAGTLVNLPHISTLQFYQTSETDSSINMLKGNDIAVSNGALSFVAPPNSIFTLTGLVDGADLTPPTVSITTPIDGGTVSNTVIINAAATDNVGVAGVQFLLNGANLGGKIYSPPYSLSWDTKTVASGNYTLSAMAQDIGGNTANSSLIHITVTNQDTTPPTITITNPLQNAVVSGTITVTATSTDNVGVAGVQFLLDGTPFKSEVTATPYSVTLDTTTISDGTHTIAAIARDTSNNKATSKSVSFTVINKPGSIFPIRLVQSSSNITSSAQSLAEPFPLNVTAGNLVVVSVSSWPNLPASTAVTDSLGNTYSIAGTVLTTQGVYSAIYYAKNVKGGADTVTFNTVKSGGQISMAIAEFSGADTASPLDKTAGTVGSGNAPSSGNMAPSLAGDLVIGSGTHNGNTVTTAGSGFTLIAVPTEDSNTHQPLAMEYQVLSGNQQTTATFNLAVGYPWTQNGVLFKPAVMQGPDTTPPTVTAFAIPATATALTVTITSFTATDNVGVTGYLVNESPTAPAPTAAGWSTTVPTSYTFTTAGNKTLYAWAKDAAGNVSASSSASVVITLSDTTPPTVTVFTIPATATALTVTITSFTATDNVGVTGYLVNESPTAPAPTAAGWSTTVPTSYTFTTAGNKTLYAWAKDAAGNVSASRSASVTVTLSDTTPPTVTVFTIPATATKLTVTITSFTATDNVGVTGYLVNESPTAPAPTAAGWSTTVPTSYTFTTAGNKTLYAWAKDAAGNVSASRSASVVITLSDVTPPSAPANLSAIAGGPTQVSLNWTASTDNVGVTGYRVMRNGSQIATSSSTAYSDTTVAAGTAYSYTVRAYDAAGNVSADSNTASVTTPTLLPAPVLDVTVTTRQSAGSRTISSPSFSTTRPNELLVAFIASDGPNTGGAQQITAVTGGGLTWTLRSRANAQAGTAEIWQARATNVVSNVIVTATRATGSYQGMITVAAFQGASLVANGAAANASAASGAPTVSFVTTRANSVVWGVGDDWDRAVTRTVSPNQTKLSEYLAPAGDTFWIQYITAPVAVAGVSATISCTAPTNDRWNLAAIEIVSQ